MKIVIFFLAAIGVLVVLFLLYQGFFKPSSSGLEQYNYDVLENIEDIEIRRYESATFSSVETYGTSYRDKSSEGFSVLAGYIFGGNKEQKKIAMTTPVTMDLGDTSTMSFMVPHDMKKEDLPTPNDGRISFRTEPEKTVAAIRFSGWASDHRNEKFAEKLASTLAKHNISHTGKFTFLGYNPPYEVVNRRNEVIVELPAYPQKNQ